MKSVLSCELNLWSLSIVFVWHQCTFSVADCLRHFSQKIPSFMTMPNIIRVRRYNLTWILFSINYNVYRFFCPHSYCLTFTAVTQLARTTILPIYFPKVKFLDEFAQNNQILPISPDWCRWANLKFIWCVNWNILSYFQSESARNHRVNIFSFCNSCNCDGCCGCTPRIRLIRCWCKIFAAAADALHLQHLVTSICRNQTSTAVSKHEIQLPESQMATRCFSMLLTVVDGGNHISMLPTASCFS